MKQQDALTLLEECLQELEKTSGSSAVALGKLFRIASLLELDDIKTWCLIHQGEEDLIYNIKQYVSIILDIQNNKNQEGFDLEEKLKIKNKIIINCEKNGISQDFLNSTNELNLLYKLDFPLGVRLIETIYNRMSPTQLADGKYYRSHIERYLSYIKNQIYHYVIKLHESLKYSGEISNCFDVLKSSIDDKLLDLNPELAEQLMTVFKSVNTNDPEQWSHSLTSCRRLLEGLADELFPATEELVEGRKLKQTQYINRLWAFMDKSIESESNRDLAKAHVDYLGGWLQRGYKVANKGVHAEIGRLEATKLVFHIYLVLADILEYLDQDISIKKMLNLHDASMDEMEALAGISRDLAKEIVKLRVSDSPLTDAKLLALKGLGQKTLEKIKESFVY